MAGKDTRGSWEVGKVRRDTGSVGKMGRSRVEEKQCKLMTEGREGEKKVTFKLGNEIGEKEEWDKLKGEMNEIKEEIKSLREDCKIYREVVKEIKVKIREYEERMAEQEKRLKELENQGRGREMEEVENGGGSEGGESRSE